MKNFPLENSLVLYDRLENLTGIVGDVYTFTLLY